MSWNRRRRYLRRWERYQRRCDVLSYGTEMWFMGRDYNARWDARWAITRHNLINRGVASKELSV